MDWKRLIKEYHARTVYYLIFLGTIVLAGFIIWDMISLIRNAENEIFAHTELAELYVKLLFAFGGYREIMRWVSKGDQDSLGHIYYRKIVRGDRIVCFWICLSILAVSLKQLLVITRIPHTLLYATEWSMYVLLGTRVSKYAFNKSKAGRSRSRGAADSQDDEDFKLKVIGYITSHGRITNDECQKEFNLTKSQSYYGLSCLCKKKVLKAVGRGKGRKYVLGENT